MSADAPPLGAELVAGLRRLKLATIRSDGPEVLQTARTQRWPPEEVLRVLVAAEITARERSNQRLRLKAAGFHFAFSRQTGLLNDAPYQLLLVLDRYLAPVPELAQLPK